MNAALAHEVDWDFTEAPADPLHNIHPYPTRFIPQIPRELIRIFHPGDDSAVLDPFCGSGTTLVEAVSAGLPAVGVDLSPLAILISRVKTTPLKEPISPIARGVISDAKRHPTPIPAIPRLDHWFRVDVQDTLARLRAQIEQVADQSHRDALNLAFSSIIVRVSNQESDTRYAAVTKEMRPDQVYNAFYRATENIQRAIFARYNTLFATRPICQLIHKDTLSTSPTDIDLKVGLVVTSPPYPNAYENWLYHKYRMYWLGMDPLIVRKGEIGARPHFFRKIRPHTAEHFQEQMARCLQLVSGVLQPGGVACFVVGRSVIRGQVVDNAELVSQAAVRHGFRQLALLGRSIKKTRKAFNPSIGKIHEESIVVLRLER
ncbi:MAG: DNA methyltransferase [Dehalococcoidia bacterium]|nr:DNA methyltransferase [Dehalococcoidia bacterium]